MSRTALAAVLTQPRRFELREFPIPEIGDDDGILRVEACGLCGTDYEQWRGHLQNWGGGMPIIPGHEVIGWIEAIGREAGRRWKVREGDRVAIEPVVPCGHCSQCLTGAYTRCESDMGYGLYCNIARAPSLWGGYASHVYLHPRSVVHRLPSNVPTHLMTLVNPLSNSIRWVHECGGVGIGSTVGILGPGQRGLLAVVAAKEAGAARIIVTGTAADEERLKIARKLGASATIDVTQEDPIERVRDLTGGQLADVVLDVSAGAVEPITQAVEMVRRGGRIVLAGLKGDKPAKGLLTDRIVFRELQIIGVLSAGWTSTEQAIDLVQRRADRLSVLCTHAFGLDQVDAAVRSLGREGANAAEAIHVTLDVAGQGRGSGLSGVV